MNEAVQKNVAAINNAYSRATVDKHAHEHERIHHHKQQINSDCKSSVLQKNVQRLLQVQRVFEQFFLEFSMKFRQLLMERIVHPAKCTCVKG